GAQRMAGGEGVHAGATQSAGAETGGGQIGPADAPGPAFPFAEQVMPGFPFQVLFLSLQVVVLIKLLHFPSQSLLPFALPVLPALPQPDLQGGAAGVFAEAGAFGMAEHIAEGI